MNSRPSTPTLKNSGPEIASATWKGEAEHTVSIIKLYILRYYYIRA